jgi:hypothetical protein
MPWPAALLSTVLALAGAFLVFIGFIDRRDGLAVAGAILLGSVLMAMQWVDDRGGKS